MLKATCSTDEKKTLLITVRTDGFFIRCKTPKGIESFKYEGLIRFGTGVRLPALYQHHFIVRGFVSMTPQSIIITPEPFEVAKVMA